MTEPQRTIVFDNEIYRLVAFLDEEGNKTDNAADAVVIVYQAYEDQRPDGTPQQYKMMQVPKGSVVNSPLS